jgi:hypothetical protein
VFRNDVTEIPVNVPFLADARIGSREKCQI